MLTLYQQNNQLISPVLKLLCSLFLLFEPLRCLSETRRCRYREHKRAQAAESESGSEAPVLQFLCRRSVTPISAQNIKPQDVTKNTPPCLASQTHCPPPTAAHLFLQQSRNVNKNIAIRAFFFFFPPPGFLHYLIGDRRGLCNKLGHTPVAYKPAHATLRVGICKLASLFSMREGC